MCVLGVVWGPRERGTLGSCLVFSNGNSIPLGYYTKLKSKKGKIILIKIKQRGTNRKSKTEIKKGDLEECKGHVFG